MGLNPGGANYSWHYSNKHDDKTLSLTGTIVAIQEVQAREYNHDSNQPGRPAFWPDGNPKMNIRIAVATPEGSLKSFVFAKAGIKQQTGEKPSLHMQLFSLSNGNMMNLMGKTINIWTWDAHPETGQTWGQGNPRLFGVSLVEDQTYELSMPLPDEFKVAELYANDSVQGGQPVAPPPQQIQQPQMQGNFYAPPMVQQPQPQYQPQQYQQQAMPMHTHQPMPQQPMPQQPVMPQQPMPAVQAMPPQTAPMPQGMDPAVAQAMQAVGAVNVQPVDASAGIYDDDIPF